jgi:prolyl-tRNA editing enzyme YbaK/EbsC (Cys-tRNA(Pro) deacylase)
MTGIGQRLLDQLIALGIEAELIMPGAAMPTVAMAAAAIGVDEAAIIKSVLFDDLNGGVVLGIASGVNRISRARLAEAVGGSKLRLASPDLVLAKTGFPAGGVAPVLHRCSMPVVIDAAVGLQDWVYGGAGTEDGLLKLRPGDIARLTNATIADIVENV